MPVKRIWVAQGETLGISFGEASASPKLWLFFHFSFFIFHFPFTFAPTLSDPCPKYGHVAELVDALL